MTSGVEVAAFDHETSARARIDAGVGEPGTVLAPGRLLAAIAAELPRQPIELASDGAGPDPDSRPHPVHPAAAARR